MCRSIRLWAMCALSAPRNWNTLAPALVVIMILLLLKKPRPVSSPTASSAATVWMRLYGIDTMAMDFTAHALSWKITRLEVMPTNPVPPPLTSRTASISSPGNNPARIFSSWSCRSKITSRRSL
jgi:hypothetical protein